MKVLAFDLGLNVGWAIKQPGERPVAGSFHIPHKREELGQIGNYFAQHAGPIFAEHKPDVVARATRFINRQSTPANIGPYYGLSMVLDMLADGLGLECYEIDEQTARKSFLGKVPRGSAAIKRAVINACAARGWWAKNDHGCDAICVSLHVLELLQPKKASLQVTPLFKDFKR